MLKSLRISHVFIAFMSFISAFTASAYSIRCNGDQSICEITTNRLAVGDKIGVFSEDEYLVAIGRVDKINDQKRTIRIIRSYGVIAASHQARFIEDDQALKPEENFYVLRVLPKTKLNGEIGILSLGAGDELAGLTGGGSYSKMWRNNTYFIGGADVFTSAGKASDKLNGVVQTDVSASGLALSGGLSQILFPNSKASIELSGRLGLAWLSINISDNNADVTKVLNDRIHPGFGLYASGKVGLILHWKKFTPGIGFVVSLIHNATAKAVVGSISYAL